MKNAATETGKTFVEMWKDWDMVTRDEHAVAIHNACNSSLRTVFSWAFGARSPKYRNKLKIAEYLKKQGISCTTFSLFPTRNS